MPSGLGSNNVLNQADVAAGTRTTFIPDIQGSIIGTLELELGDAEQARLSALWREREHPRQLCLYRPTHRSGD